MCAFKEKQERNEIYPVTRQRKLPKTIDIYIKKQYYIYEKNC